MNVIMILRIVLGLFALVSLGFFVKDLLAHKEDFTKEKAVPLAIIGCITNLLDTWGIGSYATTQAGFKFTKSSPDETIPGTLNVGDTFPVTLEALLFFSFVDIDPLTLVLMLAGSVVGALVGAGIVCKWNVKYVRIGLWFWSYDSCSRNGLQKCRCRTFRYGWYSIRLNRNQISNWCCC